jgi:hypothetical protein
VNTPRPATTKTHAQPSVGAAHTVRFGGWRISLRIESVEWVGEDKPVPRRKWRSSIPKPESERTLSIQDLRGIYRALNLGVGTTPRYEREFAKREGGMFAELRPFLRGDEWRIPLTAVRKEVEMLFERHPDQMPPAAFWDDWGK